MNFEDLKEVAWGLAIISIFISISIEFPMFGVLLVLIIISFLIWGFRADKRWQKDYEITKEIEEKENKKNKNYLINYQKNFKQ